jgi:hypothetical protein
VRKIFVQFPTFGVVRALDERLSKQIGDKFSSTEEQQRLVAILLALKGSGFITSIDRGRETWFFFDPKENLADDVLLIELKKSEMLRSIGLSERIAPTLKEMCQKLEAEVERLGKK